MLDIRIQIVISPKDARAFRSSLLRWFRQCGRDLPWRRTRDPYAVLVSELMLQQTQVATVLPYYRNWLRRFPDFASLANASERDVLLEWQGLGYYNRARYLRDCARIVHSQHRGKFPSRIDAMLDLPGVGRYTAHAIATFALDQPVPIVEANTARVLSRLFDSRLAIESAAGRNGLWENATALVPKKSSAIYNSALVDLGALVCLPRKPRCQVCPVKKFCAARDPESLPIKQPRLPVIQLTEDHLLIVRRNRVLLEQSTGRWRKMWILPPLKLDRNIRSSSPTPIYTSTFPFTHHRIMLRVFGQGAPEIDSKRRRWFAFGSLDSIPVPSPHRRAIEQLLSEV